MVLFLDSGIGGLIYQETFRTVRPSVRCEYIADSEFFPYGERSPQDVCSRVVSLVRNRLSSGVRNGEKLPDAVVIACNTASVVALAELRKTFAIPFVGVVPAVKPAAALTRTGHIAILATSRTNRDPYTEELVQRFAHYCRVSRIGLPRLVQAAEVAICGNDPHVRAMIREDVAAQLERTVDTVVLACTHFVRYRKIFEEELGTDRRIVDSLDGVITRLVAVVGAHEGNAENARPRLTFTGSPTPHLRCLGERYRVDYLRNEETVEASSS